MSALKDAKDYLYRYGWNTDTTTDPIDLLRALVKDMDQLLDEQGYLTEDEGDDEDEGEEDDEDDQA